MSWIATLTIYTGLITAIFLLLFGLWVACLPWSIRPLMKLMLLPRYSIRFNGLENIPQSGPVMLVANHVTWIDGFVIASVCRRPITVLVNKDYCDNPGQRWISRRMNIIPIPHKGPKAQKVALELMRKALDDGRTVGMFPEGQLTRSGVMNPFQRGMEIILKGKEDVLIVPIGLAGLWGSIFSFSEGRFFKKWPKGMRRKVGVSFGKPLAYSTKAINVRTIVQQEIVKATSLITDHPTLSDAIDLELGHWRHPQLGLLTASAPDFIQKNRDIHQIGNKPGSVGQALPGVAIRIVDQAGEDLGFNHLGRIELQIVPDMKWIDSGCSGKIEPDGFLWLENPDDGYLINFRRLVTRTNGTSVFSDASG